MYDFYFGSKSQIVSNKKNYLIFLKHLLPRWLNSIPDSEYLAIWDSLNKIRKKNPVIIETGIGSSTLAMLFYVILNNGKLISWDVNQNKGSELKLIILETLCKHLSVNLFDYWVFIPFNSLDRNVGIPVLNELKLKPSYGFFGSYHTSRHLIDEINLYCDQADKNFFVAIDDSYYTKKEYNYAYMNMIRKKLSLSEVIEPSSNKGETFYVSVEKLLSKKYKKLKKLKDTFKNNYKEDIFYKYYDSDRKVMHKLKMEDLNNKKHRFDVWQVKK